MNITVYQKEMNQMSSYSKCVCCAYWYCEKKDGKYGECRYNPPTLFNVISDNDTFVDFVTKWPVTEGDDFCGKYSSEYGGA